MSRFPPARHFSRIDGRPDPDTTRLYFGKSFAYPLFAAPFVRVFGTNGFLVLNALLLAAAFFAVYLFLSARSGIVVGLLLASSFIFASVIPVYFVWTTPELFNFSLAVLAYFLWLYKYVAPAPTSLAGGLLRASSSDWVAAAIVGLLTFSKVTNVLLLLPPVVWLLWQREWRRALAMSVVAGAVTVMFFGANVVSSGEWNYQGGDRATCYNTFPFQEERWGLDTTPGCEQRGRSTGLFDEIFDPKVFWSNLRANVGYFFVGRYGGLLAYFFPAVFAIAAFGLARGRRESWQWCVLGGVLLSIALFIVTLPYTYLGGGGSVGNRYFTAVYGLCVFLFPPMRSTAAALVPWIVGGFFMAKLILNPFQTSIRPFEPAKRGALRMFPIELTNVNDLPNMNEGHRVRVPYGNPATAAAVSDLPLRRQRVSQGSRRRELFGAGPRASGDGHQSGSLRHRAGIRGAAAEVPADDGDGRPRADPSGRDARASACGKGARGRSDVDGAHGSAAAVSVQSRPGGAASDAGVRLDAVDLQQRRLLAAHVRSVVARRPLPRRARDA